MRHYRLFTIRSNEYLIFLSLLSNGIDQIHFDDFYFRSDLLRLIFSLPEFALFFIAFQQLL